MLFQKQKARIVIELERKMSEGERWYPMIDENGDCSRYWDGVGGFFSLSSRVTGAAG